MPSSNVPHGMPGPALLTCLIGGESWQAKDIRPNNAKQQCRCLARFFRQPSPLAMVVRSPALRLFTAVAQNTNLLNDCHPDEWDATAVLTRLAWCEPRWLRAEMAAKVIRDEPTKGSIASKRKRACLDPVYRLKMLLAGITSLFKA